jgi:hypothetical protein
VHHGGFLLTDRNREWKRLPHGLPEKLAVHALAVQAANPDIVFAGIQTGLRRSTDRAQRTPHVVMPQDMVMTWLGRMGVECSFGRRRRLSIGSSPMHRMIHVGPAF